MSHKTLHTHSPKFERLVPLLSRTSAHLGRFKDEEHRRTKRASRTYVSFFVIHSIILDLLLPPTPQYLVSPQIYEMNIESNKSLCTKSSFLPSTVEPVALLTFPPPNPCRARNSRNLLMGLIAQLLSLSKTMIIVRTRCKNYKSHKIAPSVWAIYPIKLASRGLRAFADCSGDAWLEQVPHSKFFMPD